MTKDSSAKRKTGKRKPEKLSFTQDFIPIKNLDHGIIETADGRYIKILEVEPINFMLRSEEEQYEIICSFASWLKISPVHLQFKSITRKADSDKHIAMLRKEMETEESEQCKKLSEGYIRLIKDVGSREALTRRFFLIFRYEELRRNENSDYGQICSTLLTAEQNARAYFMQCGNNILQPKDPDEATAEILYMFFNRRSCVEEPFHSRVDRIVLDTMAAKNKVIGIDPIPHIRMAHFIAPRGIDLMHRNYIIMDGLYYSFLYIKGNGYPNKVRAGWMSSLINAGEGIDVDVFLRRDMLSERTEFTIDGFYDDEIHCSLKAEYAISEGESNLRVYSPLELKMLLAKHFLWLNGDESGQQLQLYDAYFEKETFEGVDLSSAVINNCKFVDCNFYKGTMCFSEVTGTKFCNCMMMDLTAEEANFHQAEAWRRWQ